MSEPVRLSCANHLNEVPLHDNRLHEVREKNSFCGHFGLETKSVSFRKCSIFGIFTEQTLNDLSRKRHFWGLTLVP